MVTALVGIFVGFLIGYASALVGVATKQNKWARDVDRDIARFRESVLLSKRV